MPPFIIAEAGVNHNGDVGLALALVRKAAACGADCVKFQTFFAESLAIRTAPKAEYQVLTTPAGESQFEMLKRLELSKDAHIRIMEACAREPIAFLSTPYGTEEADMLDELGVVGFKIASGQITELAFIEHVARKRKPVVLSTGMSTLGEVEEAVQTVRAAGNEDIVVLQCTTNYPSRIQEANLRAMVTMREAFDVVVGYSDHTQGIAAAIAATALGARVIEKHFTLDASLPGPDHSSSAEPHEFAVMVGAIRDAWMALGSPAKRPTEGELRNVVGMRRGVVAARDIEAGAAITPAMLALKRPAVGLPPSMVPLLIGRRAKRRIAADEPIRSLDVE